GIPVVPVGRSGGASARVAGTATHRLAVERLPQDLLQSLQHAELSPALASAVAEAMRWSIIIEEVRRQGESEDDQRVARMSAEDLCRDVLRRVGTKHRERVNNANKLLTMAKESAKWSGQ